MTTHEDVAQLQAQIDDLRKQLARAQLDQWQARVENLEVQMHLEAKEATDKAFALMDQLRARWADARRQFEDSISTASSVADSVRTGLEKACEDLRTALVESKDKLAAKNTRPELRAPASAGRQLRQGTRDGRATGRRGQLTSSAAAGGDRYEALASNRT